MITFPTDWNAFVAFLIQASTAGLFLTWLLTHIPLIRNDNVTNWVKFAFAVLVCFLWAFVAFIVTTNGLPNTPNGWYGIINSGLAIAFTNQAFYGVIQNLPNLSSFFLALFGKAPITIKASSTKAIS